MASNRILSYAGAAAAATGLLALSPIVVSGVAVGAMVATARAGGALVGKIAAGKGEPPAGETQASPALLPQPSPGC